MVLSEQGREQLEALTRSLQRCTPCLACGKQRSCCCRLPRLANTVIAERCAVSPPRQSALCSASAIAPRGWQVCMMSCGPVVPAPMAMSKVCEAVHRVLHSKPKAPPTGVCVWSPKKPGFPRARWAILQALPGSNLSPLQKLNSPLTPFFVEKVREHRGPLPQSPRPRHWSCAWNRKSQDSGARTHPTDPAFGSGLRRRGSLTTTSATAPLRSLHRPQRPGWQR